MVNNPMISAWKALATEWDHLDTVSKSKPMNNSYVIVYVKILWELMIRVLSAGNMRKVCHVHNSTKGMYIINNECQACVQVDVNTILENSRLGKSEQRLSFRRERWRAAGA
jgi:hypothetical protein